MGFQNIKSPQTPTRWTANKIITVSSLMSQLGNLVLALLMSLMPLKLFPLKESDST